MTQTTAHMSGSDCKIEVSDDNAIWVDISGSANKVDPGEQARTNGEEYTFSGDTAVITDGKREPMEVNVASVYTETSGESWETVRSWFETVGGSPIYVRWSPGGGNSGDFMFTSGKGVISSLNYPPSEASEGGPILTEMVFKVPKVTQSTIA